MARVPAPVPKEKEVPPLLRKRKDTVCFKGKEMEGTEPTIHSSILSLSL